MSDTFGAFELADVRFPTSRELDGSDAMNVDPDYSMAYVTVPTGAGDAGYGFVFTCGRGTEIVVAAIQALQPHLLGRAVDEVLADLGGLWRELVGDSQLRWLGPDKGVMHMAIGAVINALWDLRARRAGLPLWKLLADLSPDEIVDLVDFTYLEGTLSREQAIELLQTRRNGAPEREKQLRNSGFPAYTTSAGWLGYDDEKVVRLAKEAVAEGFTHLKLKVGADIDDDRHRCGLVRAAVGPDIAISIDANQRWSVPGAIESIEKLAEYDLWWVEEPTSPDDILGHKQIREAITPIRVATGEHGANRVIFKQLLAAAAIDVCQIDACRVAGVNENLAILLLAAHFDVPVCPHAGGVGLCELVQHPAMFDFIALSGSTEERWIEYVDHLHEHFESPVVVQDARYQAPLSPGSGARVTDEALVTFGYPDGP
ncbi:MAG: enolase C-terminal domain-like protein, partial [Nakamurella sp.]